MTRTVNPAAAVTRNTTVILDEVARIQAAAADRNIEEMARLAEGDAFVNHFRFEPVERTRPVTMPKAPPSGKYPDIKSQYGLRPPAAITKIIEQHAGEVIVGCELEIEKFNSNGEVGFPGMDFTTDGSLRNNGIEAVTRPNTVKGLLVIIKKFWEKFNITADNFSDRTSIHVHANVLHFSEQQIKSLVLIYSLLEDIMFDIVGEERRDNIFCCPWTQAGLHLGNYHRVWSQAAHWQKYTALNLKPISTQGTVEFRHMYGHCDHTLLTYWLMIIEDIMVSAESIDNETIYKRVLNLNSDSTYAEFITQLLPNTAQYVMSKVPNWQHHLARGVIEAKLSTVSI